MAIDPIRSHTSTPHGRAAADAANGKRQIDRERDGAYSFDLDLDHDDTGIAEIFGIGEGRLLIITGKAIYEVKLPDQIDPARQNLKIKHPIQQMVLARGVDDDYVCRILLTAKTLFHDNFLGTEFDYVRAVGLAFDGLKDIAAMRQLHIDLEQAQNSAWERFPQQQWQERGAIRMPSITDIEARCEAYMQKANHVVICLEEIAKLFYRDELRSKWINSLARLVSARYGEDSPFSKLMDEALPLLLLINNARNAVEHPAPDMRLVVTDFDMNEHGEIAAPTVEFVHPRTPTSRATVTEVMAGVTEAMVTCFEVMMAHLCANNVVPFGNMPLYVDEIPEDRRPNKKVRYGYLVEFNGALHPLG